MLGQRDSPSAEGGSREDSWEGSERLSADFMNSKTRENPASS